MSIKYTLSTFGPLSCVFCTYTGQGGVFVDKENGVNEFLVNRIAEQLMFAIQAKGAKNG